jgi:NTE family protein
MAAAAIPMAKGKMIMAQPSTDHGPEKPGPQPKIGIALGAGGAKGIAHIPMLEALDELGITPHRIAGCSIGAVMGALYASGLSAREIKDKIAKLAITRSDTMRGVFSDRKINKWMAMIDPDFRRSGLIKSESIMAELCEDRTCETFEELAIPFSVVATDFWGRRAVVLDSGPLKPAVQASMALPGLFTPVELDGRVLIDGGTVNPVPYDVLTDSCDLVIAIDINSGSAAERGTVPGYFDTVFGSIQIMQQAIVKQELRASPPDIYIRPELGDFRTLHFYKADEIYRQAQPAKEELKRRLGKKLAAWNTQPGRDGRGRG